MDSRVIAGICLLCAFSSATSYAATGTVQSSALPLKTTPVAADRVIINDSEAGNAPRQTPLANLPIPTSVQTELDKKSADTHTHVGVYLEEEVDGSTTNEIQTLGLASNTLSISGGNSVTLPDPALKQDALPASTGTDDLLCGDGSGGWTKCTVTEVTFSAEFVFSNGVLSLAP